MSSTNFASPKNSSKVPNTASAMLPQERKRLAIEAIGGIASITQIATASDTSRKFIYVQKQTAESALEEAFSECASHADSVLFYLPITKGWIYRLIPWV